MRLLLISTLILFVACSGDDDDCKEIGYNETNQIAEDVVYCFDDGTEMTVLALNNEFCPCNVECGWEGQMTIDLFWTLANGDTLSYRYNSAGQVMINETLPNEMVISSVDEDINFEVECSESDPSPKILSAGIMVSN